MPLKSNPLIIYKEPNSDGTKFKYEISIYFGERFDKDGNKFSDNNIFLSTPSIYDSNDKEMSYMFPNDARLRSLTYAMYIFCNIQCVRAGRARGMRFVKLSFFVIVFTDHSPMNWFS